MGGGGVGENLMEGENIGGNLGKLVLLGEFEGKFRCMSSGRGGSDTRILEQETPALQLYLKSHCPAHFCIQIRLECGNDAKN